MSQQHPGERRESQSRPGVPAAPAVLPRVQGMVIAEYIHQEPATNLFTLHKLYNEVHARQFPAAHGLFCVFIQLTDGHGPTPLRLRLVDVDEERPPLFEATLPLVFPDPLGIHNVRYQHSGLVFERPGLYRLQLLAGEQCLSENRLLVRLVPEGPPR